VYIGAYSLPEPTYQSEANSSNFSKRVTNTKDAKQRDVGREERERESENV